jgi:hypothetical protein
MKTDQNGWNGCAHILCKLRANRQTSQKWNDFWNDEQEVPVKRPFRVERFAQGDPILGSLLGAIPYRSVPPLFLYGNRGTARDRAICRADGLRSPPIRGFLGSN